MIDLGVNFAGVRFKNPIVMASGCFGFGQEYSEYYDISKLGGICLKGLTLRPRLGNPPPRVAEAPLGMLNSVGLQNPGIEAFICDELPYLKKLNTVIIANISGETVEEYAIMAEMLSGAGVDIIEVNVSCPNVQAGGMHFGVTPESVGIVTDAVRCRSSVPIMIKLSPNVTDIAAIAKSAELFGADAISLINTLLGMRIDTATRRPVLHNNVGGLSGPAIFPIAVRMVWQVSTAVSIPVLGMGGVSSGIDAAEMMLAGASLVGVGTACFNDPYAPLGIISGLLNYMTKHGIENAEDITGGVIAH